MADFYLVVGTPGYGLCHHLLILLFCPADLVCSHDSPHPGVAFHPGVLGYGQQERLGAGTARGAQHSH